MTLFGRCRRPMYPHVSMTGFEKGLFCQQMACCSTQRCEGPDLRLWLLAEGLATSSPISSAFRINIASLAGIQSCWDPLLSHTLFPYCPQRDFWTHSALKGTENSPVGPGLYCSNQPVYLFSPSLLIRLTFFENSAAQQTGNAEDLVLLWIISEFI